MSYVSDDSRTLIALDPKADVDCGIFLYVEDNVYQKFSCQFGLRRIPRRSQTSVADQDRKRSCKMGSKVLSSGKI